MNRMFSVKTAGLVLCLSSSLLLTPRAAQAGCCAGREENKVKVQKYSYEGQITGGTGIQGYIWGTTTQGIVISQGALTGEVDLGESPDEYEIGTTYTASADVAGAPSGAYSFSGVTKLEIGCREIEMKIVVTSPSGTWTSPEWVRSKTCDGLLCGIFKSTPAPAVTNSVTGGSEEVYNSPGNYQDPTETAEPETTVIKTLFRFPADEDDQEGGGGGGGLAGGGTNAPQRRPNNQPDLPPATLDKAVSVGVRISAGKRANGQWVGNFKANSAGESVEKITAYALPSDLNTAEFKAAATFPPTLPTNPVLWRVKTSAGMTEFSKAAANDAILQIKFYEPGNFNDSQAAEFAPNAATGYVRKTIIEKVTAVHNIANTSFNEGYRITKIERQSNADVITEDKKFLYLNNIPSGSPQSAITARAEIEYALNGSSKISYTLSTRAGSDRTELHQEYLVENNVTTTLSKTETNYHYFVWGESVVDHYEYSTTNPAEIPATTSYIYYTDPAVPVSYRKVQLVLQPHGAWQGYSYSGDVKDRTEKIYSPWKDGPVAPAPVMTSGHPIVNWSALDASSKVETTTYANYKPVEETTHVAGTLLNRVVYEYTTEDTLEKELRKEFVDSTNFFASLTVRNSMTSMPREFAGRTVLTAQLPKNQTVSTADDLSRTTTKYEITNEDGGDVIVTTTSENPHRSPYRMSVSTSTYADGRTLYEKDYIAETIPSSINPNDLLVVPHALTTRDYIYDSNRELTATVVNGLWKSEGQLSEFRVGDEHTVESLDSSGRVTRTTTDKFGRTTQSVQLGHIVDDAFPTSAPVQRQLDGHSLTMPTRDDIITTYTYAPRTGGGTIVTTTVSTAGPNFTTLTSTSSSEQDMAGHTVRSTDNLGKISEHTTSAPNGPRVESDYGPNVAGTMVLLSSTAYYLDGQVKSQSGVASKSDFSDYSVAAPYQLTTTTAPATPVATHPDRQVSVTDGLGRTISLTRRLSANSTQFYTQTTTYDDSQQVASTSQCTTAGTSVYQVSSSTDGGRVRFSALSTDATFSLETDTGVTKTQEFLEFDDGIWWQISKRSHFYIPPNSSVLTEVTDEISATGLGPFVHTAGVSSLTAISRTIRGAQTMTQQRWELGGDSRDIVLRSDTTRPAETLSWHGSRVAETFHTHTGFAVYTYDNLGRVIATTDPRTGLSSTWNYSPTTGLLLSERRAGSTVDDATYDYYLGIGNSSNLGKLKSVKNALNQFTYTAYLDVSDPVVSANIIGMATRQWGHSVYPTETITDRDGRTVELRTFRGGDFKTDTWPGSVADVTKWNYDDATGQLLSKVYAASQAGGSTSVTYNYHVNGALNQRIWQSGRTATYAYTPFGQTESISYIGSGSTAARCVPVSYTYDPVTGRMATCTDAAGVHTYTYADDGQPLTETISASGNALVPNLLNGASVDYQYDAEHRRRRFQAHYNNQHGPATDYYYSPLGRTSRIAAAGRSVDYAYVPKSNLLERRDAKVGLGATGTKVLSSTHLYDAKGNLTDVQNMRQAPFNVAVLAHHYGLDALNRREVAEREDGTHWTYGYDSRSQVTSGKKYLGTGPLPGMQNEYEYDNIGNRLVSKDGGNITGGGLRTTSYLPNSLNQYTSITRSGFKTDFVGTAGPSDVVSVNGAAAERVGPWWRAEVTPTPGSLFGFGYVELNGQGINGPSSNNLPLRAPAYPMSTSFESNGYDADGNLLRDGRQQYVWDEENRLIEAWAPGYGTVATFHLVFAYDSQSRRIWKKVFAVTGNGSQAAEVPIVEERYLYDGWNLAVTLRSDGVQSSPPNIAQSYIWGPDLSGSLQGAGGVGGLLMTLDSINAQIHFPAYDGNGNLMVLVRAETGTSATVDAAYEYDPFGRTVRATGPAAQGNPFRFSTKFTDDETGLVYYGYRYYDAMLGRWLSRDPIEERGGVNIYGMCSNRTVNSFDALGQYQQDVHGFFTYFANLAAGAKPMEAKRVAYYAWGPDATRTLNAISALKIEALWAYTFPIATGLTPVMVDFASLSALHHFHHDGHNGSIGMQQNFHALAGGRAATFRVAHVGLLGAASDSRMFGIWTHTYQDTFAHSKLSDGVTLYSPGLGHALDGEEPDKIHVRPDRFRYMAHQYFLLAKGRWASKTAMSASEFDDYMRAATDVATASGSGEENGDFFRYIAQCDTYDTRFEKYLKSRKLVRKNLDKHALKFRLPADEEFFNLSALDSSIGGYVRDEK